MGKTYSMPKAEYVDMKNEENTYTGTLILLLLLARKIQKLCQHLHRKKIKSQLKKSFNLRAMSHQNFQGNVYPNFQLQSSIGDII